jgi:very-short-patch-repair endonuclease
MSSCLKSMMMNKRVIERSMFYGAGKKIFLRAVDLRNNMTFAEKILWDQLRNRRIFRDRFKRQHPVDIFVVDFYCHKYKLAIEVDGGIHRTKEVMEHDDGRTHDIEKLGITILRFTNEEVIEDPEGVTKKILLKIELLNLVKEKPGTDFGF